jgi:hypothetical protein
MNTVRLLLEPYKDVQTLTVTAMQILKTHSPYMIHNSKTQMEMDGVITKHLVHTSQTIGRMIRVEMLEMQHLNARQIE